MLSMLGNKRTIGGIALLLAVLGSSGSTAQAQTTLRYAFKEGEKFTYVREEKAIMRMNVDGKETNMRIMQTLDTFWQVTAVDKTGQARFDQKVERVRFSVDTSKGKMAFDSKDPKASEGPIGQTFGPLLKALAGAEISLSMDTQGHTSEVKLPESFLKALKKLPANLPGVGEMFSEETLKYRLAYNPVLLPKEAVEKKKSWSEKLEVKVPVPAGKKIITVVYTYEGEITRGKQKLHEISFKTSFDFQPAPGSPITMKHKDGKGTALFDNVTGRLVEMSQTQVLDMEYTVKDQPRRGHIEETVTLKLGKKE
jgi:hypothetical protein